MSDLTERMLHLKQIPVGAMLPAPVLRVIAAHLQERTFAPGMQLMRRGEPRVQPSCWPPPSFHV